ncbi:MAG: glycosyltransferase [Verrucomicrobiaceae bacterium]|nr:glycosyltransferase [Verrucomicrobiaceae bacterium]
MSTLIVVPCFRESLRIRRFLPELCSEMETIGSVDVRLVDDGSGVEEADAMQAYVDELRTSHPCLQPLQRVVPNRGKGGAVYAGWSDSGAAEWVGFVDADGSCNAKETARLIQVAAGSSPEVGGVFASRVKMLGRSVERQLKRHLIGRVYATIVSELLDIDVYDSQCGLKLVRRRVFEQIQPRLFIERFAFDVDLLVNLVDAGHSVVEVPIDWNEVAGGKVSLVRDSWRMFQDVLKIKRRRVA